MKSALWLLALALAICVSAVAQKTFDPTLVVVVGGGLSAGFAHFNLLQTNQVQSWPSLAATAMGTIIPSFLLRSNGPSGTLNAFQPLPGLAFVTK